MSKTPEEWAALVVNGIGWGDDMTEGEFVIGLVTQAIQEAKAQERERLGKLETLGGRDLAVLFLAAVSDDDQEAYAAREAIIVHSKAQGAAEEREACIALLAKHKGSNYWMINAIRERGGELVEPQDEHDGGVSYDCISCGVAVTFEERQPYPVQCDDCEGDA